MEAKNIVTYEELIAEIQTYMSSSENVALIHKAYLYAKEKHEGQFRKSGDPYIVHVLQVAYILSQLKAGPKTISAGLLHDVIEDCDVCKEEFVEMFGNEIYMLVESVTKIGNLKFLDEKEYLAENHRKLFIAMAQDIRVILVKLVDRLHNMRTLNFMPKHKQVKIASETLEVYAPIAHRLGINDIKNELEDLSFYYLMPEKYYEIAHLVEQRKSERDKQVNQMIKDIKDLLFKHNIQVRIFGRSKHLYSIWKKMKTKNKRFEEILDLLAIRIITPEDSRKCYEILGYIHEKYLPIPGRFKDYIAMPKLNMYQSLHTTIMGEEGHIFEVQIRSEEMDVIAEKGIAAHWRYKEGVSKQEINQKAIEERLQWFKEFSNISGEKHDSALDYMNTLTKDLFEANVYVMSPKGRVIGLPNGATPIDFAYRIHTEVGHKMIGAIVNGALVPINTKLKTGDVVHIRTNKNSFGPSEDWLKVVKTNHARNKIRAFFREEETKKKEANVAKGEEIYKDEIIRRNLNEEDYLQVKKIEQVGASIGLASYVDVMNALATKSLSAMALIEKIAKHKISSIHDDNVLKIVQKNEATKKNKGNDIGVVVAGVDGVKVSLAACCAPIPPDEILGYISKGKGIKVHRKDCPNIRNEQKRIVNVLWDDQVDKKTFDVNLTIVANDRNYLLTDVVTTISQYKATLVSVSSKMDSRRLRVKLNLVIGVNSGEHLQLLIKNILKINSIRSVERVNK